MRFNKRLGGVIGALAMLIVGAAAAYAFFNATGTGSGRAAAVTAVSITVTPTTCPTADLYPGGPAGAVCFTLTNPNPYPVHFTSVTYLPGTAAITAIVVFCPATNVSISSTAPTTVNFTVGPGATTGTQSLDGVLQMASSAPDPCQGASFNVPIAFNGTQQ